MTVEELTAAIMARLPETTITCTQWPDGLWRAGVVISDSTSIERKGKTEEEALTRLLDSVIQKQAEANKGSWRDHG